MPPWEKYASSAVAKKPWERYGGTSTVDTANEEPAHSGYNAGMKRYGKLPEPEDTFESSGMDVTAERPNTASQDPEAVALRKQVYEQRVASGEIQQPPPISESIGTASYNPKDIAQRVSTLTGLGEESILGQQPIVSGIRGYVRALPEAYKMATSGDIGQIAQVPLKLVAKAAGAGLGAVMSGTPTGLVFTEGTKALESALPPKHAEAFSAVMAPAEYFSKRYNLPIPEDANALADIVWNGLLMKGIHQTLAGAIKMKIARSEPLSSGQKNVIETSGVMTDVAQKLSVEPPIKEGKITGAEDLPAVEIPQQPPSGGGRVARERVTVPETFKEPPVPLTQEEAIQHLQGITDAKGNRAYSDEQIANMPSEMRVALAEGKEYTGNIPKPIQRSQLVEATPDEVAKLDQPAAQATAKPATTTPLKAEEPITQPPPTPTEGVVAPQKGVEPLKVTEPPKAVAEEPSAPINEPQKKDATTSAYDKGAAFTPEQARTRFDEYLNAPKDQNQQFIREEVEGYIRAHQDKLPPELKRGRLNSYTPEEIPKALDAIEGQKPPQPLTPSKLQEAKEAAPKAGLTQKEMKKTLVDQLKKAKEIVAPTLKSIEEKLSLPMPLTEMIAEQKRLDGLMNKTRKQYDQMKELEKSIKDNTEKLSNELKRRVGQRLAKDGFQLDEKGRIVVDIPGDGNFATPLHMIDEYISRVEKRFPVTELRVKDGAHKSLSEKYIREFEEYKQWYKPLFDKGLSDEAIALEKTQKQFSTLKPELVQSSIGGKTQLADWHRQELAKIQKMRSAFGGEQVVETAKSFTKSELQEILKPFLSMAEGKEEARAAAGLTKSDFEVPKTAENIQLRQALEFIDKNPKLDPFRSRGSITLSALPRLNLNTGLSEAAVKKIPKSIREFWSPLSTVPEYQKLMAARGKGFGDIARVEQTVENLSNRLKKLPEDIKAQMFQALDGKIPIDMLPPEHQGTARLVRNISDIVGKMLVKRGIISKEAFENHKGEYIHYMYLKHVIGEDTPIMMSSGKLDLSIAKQRKDLTEAQQKALGLIEDVSIAAPVGLSKALGDVAKYDYFKVLSDNPNWTVPESIVDIKGQKFGIGQLADEVQTYKTMTDRFPTNTDIKARYDELNNALTQAKAKLPAQVPDGFELVPDAKTWGPLRGTMVRKEIMKDLRPLAEIKARDIGEAAKLIYDIETKGVAMFKMGKVALNLPTAVRNFVSNIIQLNMSGIPLGDVPVLYVKALTEMKNNTTNHTKAFRQGLFKTNWSVQEIGEVMSEFKKMDTGAMHEIIGGVRKLASYYGKIDDVTKFAKYLEQVERGATPQKAAMEAQKWGMDYSLASRSVKTARRHIIPFGTYQYKILPLLAETIVERPHVIAKYALLPAAVIAYTRSKYNISDDDWKKLKRELPTYMKENQSFLIMPFKDEKGNFKWVNMEYFFPWGNVVGTGRDVAQGKVGEAARDIGIGSNPWLAIASTFVRTGNPTDPFTGREIYNDLDTGTEKTLKSMEYIYNLWSPSMLTRYGAAGQTFQIGGKQRHGKSIEAPDALLRFVGINTVTPTKEQYRANILARKADLEQNLRGRLRDPKLSQADRKELIQRFQEQLRELVDAEETPTKKAATK